MLRLGALSARPAACVGFTGLAPDQFRAPAGDFAPPTAAAAPPRPPHAAAA